VTLAEQVGRNCAEARKRVGLSQMQLTRLLPMAQQDISRLECGRHCPQLPTLLRVARALGVPLTDLLDGIE